MGNAYTLMGREARARMAIFVMFDDIELIKRKREKIEEAFIHVQSR